MSAICRSGTRVQSIEEAGAAIIAANIFIIDELARDAPTRGGNQP
jgi:hypothetical protein